MSFKKKMQKFGRYTWELIKSALPTLLMYVCMSLIALMLMMGKEMKFEPVRVVWWAVCLVAVIAYNAVMSYGQGGMGFEMLVSGNLRRMTDQDLENGYKMSRYKLVKEYRPWKGFVVGGILAIFPIVSGIIFGCNQTLIDGIFKQTAQNPNPGFAWLFLIFLALSGWSSMLFILLNATTGASISYFIGIAFALVPILVSGFMYIAGAYGKRRKTLRAQELADKASQIPPAPKKINYGGLPGTKPKKKK